MVVTNQPDIVVIDMQDKVLVVDVKVPSDSNIRKKEQKKLGKYQGLKEELKRMWSIKTSVVTKVMGALKAVTPKLGELF